MWNIHLRAFFLKETGNKVRSGKTFRSQTYIMLVDTGGNDALLTCDDDDDDDDHDERSIFPCLSFSLCLSLTRDDAVPFGFQGN